MLLEPRPFSRILISLCTLEVGDLVPESHWRALTWELCSVIMAFRRPGSNFQLESSLFSESCSTKVTAIQYWSLALFLSKRFSDSFNIIKYFRIWNAKMQKMYTVIDFVVRLLEWSTVMLLTFFFKYCWELIHCFSQASQTH